jgi:hypothetical protein
MTLWTYARRWLFDASGSTGRRDLGRRARLAVREIEDRTVPTGVVTEFSNGITAGSYPYGITPAPDGNLWFAEFNGNAIGRITPQGTVTEFSTGITPNSGLRQIAAGPDGNLWFTEDMDRIGRITPAGQVTEFTTGITSNSGPFWVAAGPDGNLWFTEQTAGEIGRITPSGKVTEFSNSGGRGITTGPDGNIWFTEPSADRVARLHVNLPTGTTINSSAATAAYGQTIALDASVALPNQQYGRGDAAGYVSFYDGSNYLGAATVSGEDAILSVNGLAPGPHTLKAVYAGDGNYDTSTSTTLNEQVNPAATSTSLAASTIMSTAGDLVTLTATVTNTNSPATPAGYVTFYDGTTTVGVSTLSGGIAAVGVSPTLAVTHHLTATFTPAAGFQPSSTPTTTDLAVTPAAATQLMFTGQPGFALSGKYVQNAVSVAVEDKYGNVETGSAAAVTRARELRAGRNADPDGNEWHRHVPGPQSDGPRGRVHAVGHERRSGVWHVAAVRRVGRGQVQGEGERPGGGRAAVHHHRDGRGRQGKSGPVLLRRRDDHRGRADRADGRDVRAGRPRS